MVVSHYVLAGIVFVAALLVAHQFSGRILDWLRFQSIGTRDYVVDKLKLMMIDIPQEKVLMGQIALSVGLGGLTFLLCLPNIQAGAFFGLLVLVMGWFVPRPAVDYMYRKRNVKFVLQMVDGLGLMSNGMRSGLSVVQAMDLVVQEMENPIKQEFALIMNQNKLGVSLEEAFVNLSKRILADEVEMFVTSVNILKETGGNLSETFDTISTMIRERIKVENKIQAIVATAFFQGIILMCVPPGLAIILNQSDPEMMKPMFHEPIGWLILGGVVVLEVVAYILIKKITSIEV